MPLFQLTSLVLRVFLVISSDCRGRGFFLFLLSLPFLFISFSFIFFSVYGVIEFYFRAVAFSFLFEVQFVLSLDSKTFHSCFSILLRWLHQFLESFIAFCPNIGSEDFFVRTVYVTENLPIDNIIHFPYIYKLFTFVFRQD